MRKCDVQLGQYPGVGNTAVVFGPHGPRRTRIGFDKPRPWSVDPSGNFTVILAAFDRVTIADAKEERSVIQDFMLRGGEDNGGGIVNVDQIQVSACLHWNGLAGEEIIDEWDAPGP